MPALLELLIHDDGYVKSQAKEILLTLKDPRAVEPLAEGIGGDDFFKRNDATRNARRWDRWPRRPCGRT